MRFFSRVSWLFLGAIAACSGGSGGGDTAPAVTPPYTSGFDSAAETDGWLFWNPDDPNTPPSSSVSTLWAFDGTAATMPGGASVSASTSLNYNNGLDYNNGTTRGVAISPKIDIGVMTAPIVIWKCNYETEDAGLSYDQRHVKVGYLDSNMNPVYYVEEQLSTSPGSAVAGACQGMGTWHEHSIALDPSWGQVRVAFGFDSVDASANAYHGWFVEDFAVIEAASYTPWTGGGGGTGGGGSGGGSGGIVAGPYSTNFDSAAATSGWTFAGTAVKWDADATPGSVPGGAYASAPASLNYNDGIDYDDGTANVATATSPLVDISAMSSPVLKFKCNYETETAGTLYDQRWVRIKTGQTSALLAQGQLAESGGWASAGACASSGTWHLHTVALDSAWGVIKVQFTFETVDVNANTFAGWFVDDLAIVAGTGTGGGGGGGGTGSGGTGTGTGTGSGGSVPVVDTHDNPNGNRSINDTYCSASGAPSPRGWLAMLAALLAAGIGVRGAARRRFVNCHHP